MIAAMSFMLLFSIWMLSVVGQYNRMVQMTQMMQRIEVRLQIETELIRRYRNGGDYQAFTWEGWSIVAENEGMFLNVFVHGRLSYSFRYVIMDDGSLKVELMEE